MHIDLWNIAYTEPLNYLNFNIVIIMNSRVWTCWPIPLPLKYLFFVHPSFYTCRVIQKFICTCKNKCWKWFKSPCARDLCVSHTSRMRRLGHLCAHGLKNHFPFPALVLTFAQEHLNHPVCLRVDLLLFPRVPFRTLGIQLFSILSFQHVHMIISVVFNSV
jgi:hypothetical protein